MPQYTVFRSDLSARRFEHAAIQCPCWGQGQHLDDSIQHVSELRRKSLRCQRMSGKNALTLIIFGFIFLTNAVNLDCLPACPEHHHYKLFFTTSHESVLESKNSFTMTMMCTVFVVYCRGSTKKKFFDLIWCRYGAKREVGLKLRHHFDSFNYKQILAGFLFVRLMEPSGIQRRDFCFFTAPPVFGYLLTCPWFDHECCNLIMGSVLFLVLHLYHT